MPSSPTTRSAPRASLTAGGEVPFTDLPARPTATGSASPSTEPGELAVTIDEGPANLDINYRVINTDWNELVYWVAGLPQGRPDRRLCRPAARRHLLSRGPRRQQRRPLDRAGDAEDGLHPDRRQQRAQQRASAKRRRSTSRARRSAHILPLGDADLHVFYAAGPRRARRDDQRGARELSTSPSACSTPTSSEIQYWIAAPRPGGEPPARSRSRRPAGTGWRSATATTTPGRRCRSG